MKNLKETNLLIVAGANVVADLVARREERTGKKQEPYLKRRMKKKIKDIESGTVSLSSGYPTKHNSACL